MPNPLPWRFGLIANTQDIADRILAHTNPETETVSTLIVGEVNIAAHAAKLLAEGCEVLIGHGSVGEQILSCFGHSAVHIPKSERAILKCLCEAGQRTRKVAVAVHDNEEFEPALYEAVLGLEIVTVSYANQTNLETGLLNAYRKGFRAVMGGGLSRRIMEALGGAAFTILPDSRLVNMALRQARAIAEAKRQDARLKNRLFSILRLTDEGVVCIDDAGTVMFANGQAHIIFGKESCREGKLFPRHHAAALDFYKRSLNGVPSEERLVSIGRKRYVVHSAPLPLPGSEGGTVAFLKDVKNLEAISRRVKAALYDRGLVATYSLESISGDSKPILELKRKVPLYARIDAPVLIEGETGTGKELLAHALHRASMRRDHPFVAINCSALPETLLESELFGYEEGAFTGARRGGKAGLFEMAHTGTLFLDEIGEMPPSLQQKLLRTLETKEVMRVGGDRVLPLDVRIICATNRDLPAMVRNGAFRMDLFFRIAGLRLPVPPLRQRLEDIPDILSPLLARSGESAASLTPAMRSALHSYSWPGNVRELLSLLEAYLALKADSENPEKLFVTLINEFKLNGLEHSGPANAAPLKKQLADARSRIVMEALKACNGDKNRAAKRLGISYNTLWRILGSD